MRLTHKPTGIVIECDEERSQFKNKDKAMKLLRAKLYDIKRREQDEEISGKRRAQVGTGDRSEKIRTYNYPQSRLTDHRIGLTLYTLQSVLDGGLAPVVDALIADFGVSRSAVLDVIFGRCAPRGRLPLHMPKDMETVEKHCEDKPFDLEVHVDECGNAYDFGFGLGGDGKPLG